LVILDHALRDPLHHFLHFDCQVAELVRGVGVDVEVWGCEGLVDEAVRRLGARAVFRRHHLEDWPVPGDGAVEAYAQAVAKVRAGREAVGMVWLVPVAAEVAVAGWAREFRERPPRPGEALVLLWQPVPGGGGEGRVREAFAALEAVRGEGRVVVVCDTVGAGRWLTGLTRLPVEVVSITRRVPDGVSSRGAGGAVPVRPVLAVLGDARLDKGFDVVVDAVLRQACAGDPGVDWVVQGHHGPGEAAALVPEVRRLLEARLPWVRVLLHPLKLPAYESTTTAVPRRCSPRRRSVRSRWLSRRVRGWRGSWTRWVAACAVRMVTRKRSCARSAG
jgi:hypothetical protein